MDTTPIGAGAKKSTASKSHPGVAKTDDGFFLRLVASIFTPGSYQEAVLVVNYALVFLIIVLLVMCFMTSWNRHAVVMLSLACLFLASLNWFLFELSKAKKGRVQNTQLGKQPKAKKPSQTNKRKSVKAENSNVTAKKKEKQPVEAKGVKSAEATNAKPVSPQKNTNKQPTTAGKAAAKQQNKTKTPAIADNSINANANKNDKNAAKGAANALNSKKKKTSQKFSYAVLGDDSTQ